MARTRPTLVVLVACLAAGNASAARDHLDTEGLPPYLRDRGEGLPVSMFGTYIQKGQLIVYPFLELYVDDDYEYAPDELGFSELEDYRGRYRATEGLLFVGYGISDRVAIEIEGALIDAELETSPEDMSGVPERVEESGIGDVEGQLRVRWMHEGARRPGVFSYFEVVGPTQDAGSLIGTSDWELKLGIGLVRGFSFGTLTLRGAVEYDRAEDIADLGEVAIEVLRRLSSSWRVYGGLEGSQDEIELITEVQLHLTGRVFVKLNNAFGLTSKATDWAPEMGVVMSF